VNVVAEQTAGARVLRLDARTYARALGCVHCGLCLPACPTYAVTGREGDSPRGRIVLIKALADGTLAWGEEVAGHLDGCLDCRACETACPSEVIYHELIEEARTRLSGRDVERKKLFAAKGRLLRWFFFHVMTRPGRLKLALLPARVLQRVGLWGLVKKLGLPGGGGAWGKLMRMLPEGEVWPRALPERMGAGGWGGEGGKLKVGVFATCVGSVMFSEINRKAVEVLAKLGAEVVCPGPGAGEGCCGAIHHHNADEHTAEALARRNIDAMESAGVDVVVTTVAGCGAQLREYGHLLRDDPAYAEKAKRFVARVRDISEVILQLGLPPAVELGPVEAVVTYHDACHLAHAQRVTKAPRELLARVPGVRMVPLAESEMCCGAAGTYNLTQPEMAGELGKRKAENILATGAEIVVMGNAGCALHMGAVLGGKVRVVHPVEIIWEALR
jgi:glycolate oxidase iron-sulfur subunit